MIMYITTEYYNH